MQTGAQIKTGAIGGTVGETAHFLPTADTRSSADLEIPEGVQRGPRARIPEPSSAVPYSVTLTVIVVQRPSIVRWRSSPI